MLLAQMGYTEEEKREVRFAYLSIIMTMTKKLDPARLALVMSVVAKVTGLSVALKLIVKQTKNR